GAFPLHTESAYWRTPPRYLLLACEAEGLSRRPTLVADLRQLLDRCADPLRRVTWLVDARPRFFANIVTGERGAERFRFDLDCMAPVDNLGEAAARALALAVTSLPAHAITWSSGDVLLVDNRRFAHGRAGGGDDRDR